MSIAVRCIRNGFLPSEAVNRDYFITNYSLPNDPVASPAPDEYHVDDTLSLSLSCTEPQCQVPNAECLVRTIANNLHPNSDLLVRISVPP